MIFKKMLLTDLALFDGASGAATGGEGAQGGTNGTSEVASQTQSNAEGQSGATVTSDTAEARKKAFNDLINGEYKDLYTEQTQRMIDRRFKETKGYKETIDRQQPVIDMLLQRYKIGDGDMNKLAAALDSDNAYWEGAAMEAGMTVDQFKSFQKLERENAALLKEREAAQGREQAERQMQAWYQEAETVKGKYPGFDLATEAQNPRFVAMLKSGVPVEHAYQVIHMDELMNNAVRSAAATAEKQVVDNIRARGQRPTENGASSQSAFTAKKTAANLTKEERAEYARRALRGESVSFE